MDVIFNENRNFLDENAYYKEKNRKLERYK